MGNPSLVVALVCGLMLLCLAASWHPPPRVFTFVNTSDQPPSTTELNCNGVPVLPMSTSMRFVLSKPLSYPEAIEEAKNCGGRLASMNTRSARELFLKLGLQTPAAIWVGLQSPYTQWANGAMVKDGPNYWHPGEPSNRNGKERCVQIRSDVLLNDNDCMWTQPALIEITAAQPPSVLEQMKETILRATPQETKAVYIADTSRTNRFKPLAMGYWVGLLYGVVLLLTVYPCPHQKPAQSPQPAQPNSQPQLLPNTPTTPAIPIGKPPPLLPTPPSIVQPAQKKSN